MMQPDIYPIAYAHGEFIAWNQVQISPLDRGFLFGEGLYATISVVDSQPLYCQDHLERLQKGCDQLHFPKSLENWHHIVLKIIELNKLENAGISLIVTRGVDKTRNHLPVALKPTVLCFSYPWSPSVNRASIKVDLQEDPRPLGYTHLKMNSLLPNVQASQKACAAGFDKVIFHRQGTVIEAAQANLFWIKDGELYTASDDLPLVCGITRRIIMQIAAELGITTHQGHYPLAALEFADEAFLCASLSQITPIRQISSWEYPQPGVLTQKFAQMYWLACQKEVQRQKILSEQRVCL